MVVNGWGPGAENADHGKNSKAKRLIAAPTSPAVVR
jgi:hypothetical protein